MKQEKVFEKLRQALRSRKRRMLWQRMVSILACVSVFLTTYALILPAVTMDVDEYAECGMVHHVHTDACYAQKWVPEERTLICTENEGDPYGSEADTTAWDIYAAEPDTTPAGHIHTDACYEITPGYWERGELTCALPEHEHDMNCFAGGSRLEDEFAFCPVGYQHTHSEECYVDDVLVCSLTEHTHTDACRPMEEATIESAPASDGAVAVISGMMPRGASATIEAVELSYDDMVFYFGERRAAAMRSFVAYDIKIMVNGAEWQPNETVSVTVREPAIEVAEDEALAVAHVDGATQEVSDVEVALDEQGEVCFEADGFSIFIFYTFTVDFHYGDVTFSIEGYDEILLSDLFAALGLEFDLAEIEDVYFSDPGLLAVEKVEGDWLLTSLAPFDTDETLTLVFTDGTLFEIWVTDETEPGGDDDDDDGTLPTPSPVPVTHSAIADAESTWDTDGTIKVLGSSDKPTSDIETLLQTYSRNQNGKVLTDKSVVYNGNDYVNWTYEPDEFSVTLSALAQEYYLSAEDRITAPMDLVLVLDMSSSMTSNNAGKITRLQASVNAINKLIEYVLSANTQNRIGIVTFEQNSNVRLPLAHYNYESVSVNADETSGIRPYLTISNKSTVKIDSSFYNNNGSEVRFSTASATNTQLGLKTAYDECFAKVTDTTCTVQVKNDAGSVVRSYTMNRQPVIVLLSDGEPNIIDGVKRADLSVYNIGGNNFFKLRDLGTAVNFVVDYDGATKTMIVESTDYAAGKKPEPTPAPTPAPTPEPTPAPTEAPEVILPVEAPTAPGTVTAEKNGGTIDYSNIKDGYVMAKFKENFDKRLKVRVEGPTTTYDYNLKLNEWATFPLSDGNGDYKVGIYKEASGGKYSLVVSASFKATLSDEFAPFLRPNQYVNYTNAVNTVAKAKELTKDHKTALEKLGAIYDFVVGNFAYDDDLAATVESGYLPDLEAVLASKKGICFDYAAIMAAMLRSQGIPCKLIVGYAGDVYHAWLSVYSQEDGWIDGAVFFDGKNWSRMDPTFASTGGNTEEIKKYIGDGSNYLAKYFY